MSEIPKRDILNLVHHNFRYFQMQIQSLRVQITLNYLVDCYSPALFFLVHGSHIEMDFCLPNNKIFNAEIIDDKL